MTSVLTNSDGLRRSEKGSLAEALAVCSALSVLVFASVAWVYSKGYILYYGDAQAHLNISRGIIDSRTPQFDHIGTVWLPLLHILCLPLVGSMKLWSNGLAGSVPVAFCFVIAGCCFYFVAKQTYGSRLAALIVVSCLALNPNILYLASIPMTEVVFLAGFGLFLVSMLQFRRTQHKSFVLLGVLASSAMSMTRYDGWFLIPFEAMWFALSAKQLRWWKVSITFAFLASLAPLYWFAHCWWETGNALDFYNGPYSAQAIQGGKPYPGFHDWAQAFRFYASAGELCSGWVLLVFGLIGLGCAIAKSTVQVIGFLCLPPLFYVWSVHSSGLPIYTPELWFNSYYNNRYGIAVTVLAAFASGGVTLVIPPQRRNFVFAIPVLALLPWILHPAPESWICWRESQVNSLDRREWTKQAALFLDAHRRQGQTILSSSGDVPGIYCRAHIPLAETLQLGNGPAWEASSARPDLAHQSAWAIVRGGDSLSIALLKASDTYRLADEIRVGKAPALQIYERKEAKPNFEHGENQ